MSSTTLDPRPGPPTEEAPRSQAPLARAVSPDQATLSNRRGRTLLLGFTAAHFAHHVITSLLNPMLPFIRDSFALSYTESGFLVSAFALSLGLSNAPIGVLADRFGPRLVIVAGLVLIGLMSAALAFAQSYWQLVALLILTGIVAGSYHAPAAALIARVFPTQVRGAATGLHITGGHLSFFITPIVAAALVAAGGTWRTPYLWLAITPILLGFVVWRTAPKGHERPAGSLERLGVFRELFGVFKLVGPLVSLSLLFQIGYAALLAFTSLYLVDTRGLPAEYAAAIFGVPQLVGVLGSPGAGALSDRLGRKTVILLGTVGIGPAFWALTAVPNELILLPLLAIGLFAALRQTPTEVYVMDCAPPHRRATVLGSYHMLSQELGGLAAPVLGVLAGLLGIGTAYTGVAGLMLACSFAVLLVRRWL